MFYSPSKLLLGNAQIPTSRILYVIQVLQRLDDLLSKIICQILVITQARDQPKGPITDLVISVQIDD